MQAVGVCVALPEWESGLGGWVGGSERGREGGKSPKTQHIERLLLQVTEPLPTIVDQVGYNPLITVSLECDNNGAPGKNEILRHHTLCICSCFASQTTTG